MLFTIQFGIAVKKKYASGYSIRTGLNQQEALSYTAFGDVDNEVYIECTDAIDHAGQPSESGASCESSASWLLSQCLDYRYNKWTIKELLMQIH